MASSGKNKRNLIMCATPLQMLIAKKIIDLFPNEEFDLLVVALNNNKNINITIQT